MMKATPSTRKGLAVKDALYVQSAEFWLRLGEPLAALLELQKLPKRAQRNRWALEVFRSAMCPPRTR